MNHFDQHPGMATREQMAALGPLDFLEVSQAEFKDMTDARIGGLTLPALERLRAAAKRQADTRGDDGRRIFVDANKAQAEASE